MKPLFFIILVLISFNLSSQDQLKNTFSSWHETHGGTEESGIQRTESFIFVASQPLKIKNIYYENSMLLLQTNDSIQVNQSSQSSTSGAIAEDPKETKKKISPEKRFRVFKKNNCYYVWAQYPYEWNGTLEYVFKKKTYTARIKIGFDKGGSDYAP